MAAGPGQMYFLLMKSGKLSAGIYQHVLEKGEYNQDGNHFVLVDATGAPVEPQGLSIQNSLYVYPGNPGQALKNCKASLEEWKYKAPTEPQDGSGLAVLAGELTHGEGGKAFPLPTRFDGYGAQFKDVYTQEELGLKQLARLREFQTDGQHVIVPLLPKQPEQKVFKDDEYIVEVAGIPSSMEKDWIAIDSNDSKGDKAENFATPSQKYFLAFWGGAVDGPVASNLPTLYAHALKNLSEFSYDVQRELIEAKKIVLDELKEYALIKNFNFAKGENSKRVALVNFWGGFLEHRNEANVQRLALLVHKAGDIEEIRLVLQGAANGQQQQGVGFVNAAARALEALSKPSPPSQPHFGG